MTDTEFPIVPTTYGYIKGRQCTSIYGRTYYSFEKIPYAKPPLGELRFRAPQPAEQWLNILECFKCPEKPVQRHTQTNELQGEEDCLYVNVYVKQLQTEKPLPVLVYLYGGRFQTGGAVRDSLGPDYFMHENVVLVIPNYRLGALGFLSFKDKSLKIPGNAGLKDQLAALKWVKSNCINFNGDPHNITLFGESSGAAATQYMMLTPHAKGLFHKAIIMSGSALSEHNFIEPGDYAYQLAAANGYKGEADDEIAIYNFLKQLTPADITRDILTEEERCLNRRTAKFMPTIEPYDDGICMVPMHPNELLATAWGNSIPLMIGGTSDEALLFYSRFMNNELFFDRIRAHPEYIVPHAVRQVESVEKCSAWGKEIIGKYLNNKLSKENIFEYLPIASVDQMWYYVYRTILARLKYATATKTFLYNFDFDSPDFNFFRLRYCDKAIRGVAHADDLCYLFLMKAAWKLDEQSDEYLMIRRMVSMWTQFAAKTNPNCSAISPAMWLPLETEQNMRCMNINVEMQMRELPQLQLLQYWHKLHEKFPL